MRTACDLSPRYRSMIGVDRMGELVDGAMRRESDRGAPTYDVEIQASFRDGVPTPTAPKSARSQSRVKRSPIPTGTTRH